MGLLLRQVGDSNNGPAAVAVLEAEDSATFADRRQAQVARRVRRAVDDKWAVSVSPEAVPGLPALLANAGVDLARLRNDTIPTIRELPELQVAFDARFVDLQADTATAPNVVGILEGSDSLLKREYVLVTAHMDGPGVTDPRATDRLYPGADDNAAGVAGLLALAQAFNQPGTRPRRSILFVATSGGAKPTFWGSNAFADGI